MEPTKDQSAGARVVAAWCLQWPHAAKEMGQESGHALAARIDALLAHERELSQTSQLREDYEARLEAERATVERLERERDETEKYDEQDLVPFVTCVVREADVEFERVGGSSRHWVRDCFLPLLARAGGYVLHRKDRDVTRVWYEESHVASLQQRLADAEAERDLLKLWASKVTESHECLRPHAERLGLGLGDYLHKLVPVVVAEWKAAEERAEQAEQARDEWRDMAVDVRDNKWIPTLERAEQAEAAARALRAGLEFAKRHLRYSRCPSAGEDERNAFIEKALNDTQALATALKETLRAEVVEECAEVADGYTPNETAVAVAAAIRALLSPAPREEEGK